MDGEFTLPARAFFSCEDDGFSIVDGALMRNTLELTSIEPALKLRVGEGNVFEQRPIKLMAREGDVVSVECEGDVVVHLDFAEMLARVQRPDGDFLYMGGLEDGNAGMGFMAAR
jgi:hypothetical protein